VAKERNAVEATAPLKSAKINPWLPYWAVFQMDLHQTTRSWVFRVWVLAAMLLSFGYLLHRAAIHYQAGIMQQASSFMGELLQFNLLVGSALVIVLTAGTISSERGTMADSVLSRGISRYQYFLGKLHSRLVAVVGSYFLIGVATMLASCFLLQADLSIPGTLLALLVVAAVLAIVVSCGVTISSLCNSAVLGIAILGMGLYGLGVGLALLGFGQLNPLRLLRLIPMLVQGQYDAQLHMELLGWCVLASVGAALVGLLHFARRDV
jgi:ABC-type transport system involved in multi-copper enzyme maturation permease subunit